MRGVLFASLSLAACSVEPGPEEAPQALATSFKNIAIIDRPDWPTPDSFATGRLIIDGPCLLFETDEGTRFNPIFPARTTLRRDTAGRLAVSIRGRTIAQGETVTVKGGSGEYGRVGSLDPSCADRNFIIGGLREQAV
ncbi:MAG TPA: hypothetical protein VGB79_14120 [Allosphingosinicella sp.]|jgi:hypothetical protein